MLLVMKRLLVPYNPYVPSKSLLDDQASLLRSMHNRASLLEAADRKGASVADEIPSANPMSGLPVFLFDGMLLEEKGYIVWLCF